MKTDKQPKNEVLALARKRHIRAEKDETKLGDDNAVRCGFAVITLSQPQRAMMTPGVPDRRYRHRAKRLTLWFEWKAEDGQLTQDQHRFLLAELEAGELAACGVLEDFSRVLIALFRAGATHAESLKTCQQVVDKWAARGYRPERARRPRRPRYVRA